MRPRANGRALCSGCGEPAPGYDRLQPRRFQFVPVLGLPTFFVDTMRRVNCPRCGKVKVERVPWAQGKQQATKALGWFLASWARRLSWEETATVFGVSWDRVCRAVGMAVAWATASEFSWERWALSGFEGVGGNLAGRQLDRALVRFPTDGCGGASWSRGCSGPGLAGPWQRPIAPAWQTRGAVPRECRTGS